MLTKSEESHNLRVFSLNKGIVGYGTYKLSFTLNKVRVATLFMRAMNIIESCCVSFYLPVPVRLISVVVVTIVIAWLFAVDPPIKT